MFECTKIYSTNIGQEKCWDNFYLFFFLLNVNLCKLRLLCSIDRSELNCCAQLEEHGKIGSCINPVFFRLRPLLLLTEIHKNCTNTCKQLVTKLTHTIAVAPYATHSTVIVLLTIGTKKKIKHKEDGGQAEWIRTKDKW